MFLKINYKPSLPFYYRLKPATCAISVILGGAIIMDFSYWLPSFNCIQEDHIIKALIAVDFILKLDILEPFGPFIIGHIIPCIFNFIILLP